MILTRDRSMSAVNVASSLVASRRGGSSVGQSSGLIIRRSQVQVLPAPREKPQVSGLFEGFRFGSRRHVSRTGPALDTRPYSD
jgi:hypothetical protein